MPPDSPKPPPDDQPRELQLTPQLLLHAYRLGVFPMADPEAGETAFFSPDPRAILPLDGFRIRRSLRKVVQQGRFVIRTDTAFEQVIHACAEPRPGGEQQTWISEELVALYTELHRLGFAHSIEAYRAADAGPILVGGLYGVHIGAAFFGESMFHRSDLGGTDASKICLVHLVAHIKARGFTLLDVQFRNAHLDQFGCIEIPKHAYLERLTQAVTRPVAWLPFDDAPLRAT
ncbi:MAG: leucyl/phenylalanyl-tRNA--protein transferase [Phycisphaerales bacterium]|nr:leucyl/phenylalanyl-tRNA--protein transferase [Phycisphaerales bacterium]